MELGKGVKGRRGARGWGGRRRGWGVRGERGRMMIFRLFL